MDIIEEKGIHATATKIITHKYGEKVGTATKEVLGAVASVNNAKKFHIEAIKKVIANKTD